jgi:hypothetical protein
MYYFKICNRIKLVYFLKFVVHEINSEIVKSEMVVMTEREVWCDFGLNVVECCWSAEGRERKTNVR